MADKCGRHGDASGEHPFRSIVEATPCPFALRARIGWASQWRSDEGDVENFGRIARELRVFVRTARSRKQHGFVFDIGAGQFDLTRLRDVGRRFAIALTALSGGIDRVAAEQRGWQWQFEGEPLFLNVFAACYRPPHPKRLECDGMLVVFAQPPFSFDLCNANTEQVAVKNAIRRRFERAGMAYDGALIDHGVDSLLYMSPLRPGDPPVRWFDFTS